MSLWYSLYLHYVPANDETVNTAFANAAFANAQADADPVVALTESLKQILTTAGFVQYDPFALMPRRETYAQTIKLFLAQPQNGWIRAVVDVAALLPAATLKTLPYLGVEARLSLQEKQISAQFNLYEGGMAQPLIADHLAPLSNPVYGVDVEALKAALALLADGKVATGQHNIPLDALGGNVQTMAEKVNTKQAQRMFDKFASQLLPAAQQEAAQQLLNSAAIDWTSPAGQKIAAVMACFPIQEWQQPDFVTLRNAYQLHKRHQRRPDAPLYPGDAEAMAACPNALDYTPLFLGLPS